MKNNYYNRIRMLVIIIYCLIHPIIVEASILYEKSFPIIYRILENEKLTIETDWKNLIGKSFIPYINNFRPFLAHVENEDLFYYTYKYQNSYIYVCKDNYIVHHVTVKDYNVKVCDTYVGMLPDEIETVHGKAPIAEQNPITKKWSLQYPYNTSSNYNVALSALTYTSNTHLQPITEITYGYVLPTLPYNLGYPTSIKNAEKYLQGTWISTQSEKFIFHDNNLFYSLASSGNPQRSGNYCVLSPNELSIAHTYGDNNLNIVTLHFVFSSDYNKLYFFSVDKYGVPIVETIDEWVRFKTNLSR